jgi:hypothetical protein
LPGGTNIREVLAKHRGAAFEECLSTPAANEAKEIDRLESRMNVLALTIFVTLALVCFFLFLFIVTVAEGKGSARDALLPLEEDKPGPTQPHDLSK